MIWRFLGCPTDQSQNDLAPSSLELWTAIPRQCAQFVRSTGHRVSQMSSRHLTVLNFLMKLKQKPPPKRRRKRGREAVQISTD